LLLLQQWLVLHHYVSSSYESIMDKEASASASLSASLGTSQYTATASLRVSRKGSSDFLYSTTHRPTSDAPGLHIVVSHCDKPLDWLWQRIVETDSIMTQRQRPEHPDDVPPQQILRNLKSVTVFTKCQQPPASENLPPIANVVQLPNVGRCDHSYARWIAHLQQALREKSPIEYMDPSVLHTKDQIWFVKDNDNSYRSKVEIAVSLQEMITTTRHAGFACASQISPRLGDEMGIRGTLALNIAVQKNIGRFQMYSVYHRENYTMGNDDGNAKDSNGDEAYDDSSSSQTVVHDDIFWPPNNITVLQDWTETLPIYNLSLGNRAMHESTMQLWDAHQRKPVTFQPPDHYLNLFMPICFGGVFMTSLERIHYSPVGDWRAIEQSLSRGDNIEEGHFMERLWASLLSPPLSQEEQRMIVQQDYKVVKRAGPYKGLLLLLADTNPLAFLNATREGDEMIHPPYDNSWRSWFLSWFGIQPKKLSASLSTAHGNINPAKALIANLPPVGIHVVVAHCDKPMDWIWDRLLLMNEPISYPVKSITVLTKCGKPPRLSEIPRMAKPGAIQIIELPNVGRADHSYAYWIGHRLHFAMESAKSGNVDAETSKLFLPQDQVLFVRDSDNVVYHRQHGSSRNRAKFRKLHDHSLRFGFACGDSTPASAVLGSKSPEHDDDRYYALNVASKKHLGNFKTANGKSLQDWVDNDMSAAWNISLAVTDSDREDAAAIAQNLIQENALVTLASNETLGGNGEEVLSFVPVCLSHVFMVTIESLLAAPVTDWKAVTDALSQGGEDSDEWRFMERLWALIFSNPLGKDDHKALLRQEYDVAKRKGRYKGIVTIERKASPPLPARKRKGWKAMREPFLLQFESQEALLVKYT
jgi:hypothetical protein